jgi:hypothetical protein
MVDHPKSPPAGIHSQTPATVVQSGNAIQNPQKPATR